MLRLFTFLALVVSVLGAQLEELEVNTRIVNRAQADIKDYPYMVSVRWKGKHKLGGTIIHTSFVLTAAHAAVGSDLSVEYGSTELGKGTVVPVQAVIWHGGFAKYGFLHDIAVLKLEKPLVLSDTVKIINLPKMEDKNPIGLVTIIGWGSQRALRAGELSIFSKEECQRYCEEENLDYSICARYSAGGIELCDNDDAGPVILNGKQVGIISWPNRSCNFTEHSVVFTKVAHYIEWISNLINMNDGTCRFKLVSI